MGSVGKKGGETGGELPPSPVRSGEEMFYLPGERGADPSPVLPGNFQVQFFPVIFFIMCQKIFALPRFYLIS